ncbi:MAG TPA: MFS transporter [Jatrophihabitantaceae bacterium]
MTTAVTGDPAESPAHPSIFARELRQYPGSRVRYTSLAVVVIATVVLYYQLYLAGGVAVNILSDYGITFTWFVFLQVVAVAVAGLAAYGARITDRIGRANVITIGLIVVGLLSAVAIPLAHGKWPFAIVFVALNAAEGLILVATPAVVRDFSPQLGRASAMGFWTMGPVLGSLVITIVVGSGTGSTPWQDHYIYAGIAGLIVAVLSLFFLKELAPALRDQVMVDLHDRALVEARMKGIDVEASMKHPTRQMLKPDIVLSAIAISLFLLFYIMLVAWVPTFFQVTFGFSQSTANNVIIWGWAFNVSGLIFWGWVSDKTAVRKPFMLLGAVVATIGIIIFSTRATHPDTTYSTFAWILSITMFFSGMAYVAWMASYTETVERRNPALTATGLAIWGLIIRIIFAASFFVLPFVVTTVSTIVEKGPVVQEIAEGHDPNLTAAQNATVAAVAKDPTIVTKAQSLATKYASELQTAAAIDPATQAALAADPTDIAAATKAVGEIATTLHVSPAQATARLAALARVPKADLAFLKTYGTQLQNPKVQANLKYLQANAPKVLQAQKDGPEQWQHYFWIAAGGAIVFIPLIWVMAGYWDPRHAKAAVAEHDALVDAELAKAHTP